MSTHKRVSLTQLRIRRDAIKNMNNFDATGYEQLTSGQDANTVKLISQAIAYGHMQSLDNIINDMEYDTNALINLISKKVHKYGSNRYRNPLRKRYMTSIANLSNMPSVKSPEYINLWLKIIPESEHALELIEHPSEEMLSLHKCLYTI